MTLTTVAVAMSNGPQAFAVDRFLELGPSAKATVGGGYDSRSEQFRLNGCVTFDEGVTPKSVGIPEKFNFSRKIYNSEIADEIGIGVRASFSLAMGVASASVDSSLSFLNETKTNYFQETYLASYSSLEEFRVIENVHLKDEYRSLDPAEFRQRCGDYVIIGAQRGKAFYGTVQFEINDTGFRSEFEAEVGASGGGGNVSFEAFASAMKKQSNQRKVENLNIRYNSTGGARVAVTIDDFVDAYRTFPETERTTVVHYLAVPYEDIVANWPIKIPWRRSRTTIKSFYCGMWRLATWRSSRMRSTSFAKKNSLRLGAIPAESASRY